MFLKNSVLRNCAERIKYQILDFQKVCPHLLVYVPRKTSVWWADLLGMSILWKSEVKLQKGIAAQVIESFSSDSFIKQCCFWHKINTWIIGLQTKMHNIMSIFTRRDKKRKSFTIFCHIFDLKVCKGQTKAFSEPLVMPFRNSWNMREVSVALRQASTRLGTRLPSLNQGKCFQNVADLTEVVLCGKVPNSPVSRTGEVF